MVKRSIPYESPKLQEQLGPFFENIFGTTGTIRPCLVLDVSILGMAWVSANGTQPSIPALSEMFYYILPIHSGIYLYISRYWDKILEISFLKVLESQNLNSNPSSQNSEWLGDQSNSKIKESREELGKKLHLSHQNDKRFQWIIKDKKWNSSFKNVLNIFGKSKMQKTEDN